MPSVAIDQALNLPAELIGQALLDAREDQWFDRKSARIKARKLADVLIGFANADGGIVAVGLGAGKIEGIGSIGGAIDQLRANRDRLHRAASRRDLPPNPLRTHDGQPDQLLIFDVRPGTNVVHANARDEVYLRRRRNAAAHLRAAPRAAVRPRSRQLRGKASRCPRGRPGWPAHLVVCGGHRSQQRSESASSARSRDGRSNDGRGLLAVCHAPAAVATGGLVRVLRYRGSERGSGERQQLMADERFEGPIRTCVRCARPDRRAGPGTSRANPGGAL